MGALQDGMAAVILLWSVKSCHFGSFRVALLFLFIWLAFEKLWCVCVYVAVGVHVCMCVCVCVDVYVCVCV